MARPGVKHGAVDGAVDEAEKGANHEADDENKLNNQDFWTLYDMGEKNEILSFYNGGALLKTVLSISGWN